MRRLIVALFALLAVIFVSLPATAANYNGILLDGKVFRGTVYSDQGAEFCLVGFVRDEARVMLYDGETLTLNLYNSTIGDPMFIGGKTLSGHFYRISLDDASFLFETQIRPLMGNDGMPMPGIGGITTNVFGQPILPGGMRHFLLP